MTDPRPINCRFRLQDEGKPYPRSSCTDCGRTITTGLGRSCQHVATITANVDELVKVIQAELHRQAEEPHGTQYVSAGLSDAIMLDGTFDLRQLAQAILKSGVTDR